MATIRWTALKAVKTDLGFTSFRFARPGKKVAWQLSLPVSHFVDRRCGLASNTEGRTRPVLLDMGHLGRGPLRRYFVRPRGLAPPNPVQPWVRGMPAGCR